MNTGEKRKISLFKKMFMQLAICSVIYIIFYLIKNTNYIFSDDVINKTKEILSYDINFGNIQKQVTEFFDQNKDKFAFLNIIDNNENNDVSNETTNTINNGINENNVTNSVGGMGGATDNEVIEEGKTEDKKEEQKNDEKKNEDKKSQYELDVEYIKQNYKFKKPVTGTVTSRYGEREATNIISANHQGIDIGSNMGTPIYAAMEGTVKVSSEEGEYGKHIDITNGDVLTRYAHCSKLLVKEGEKVKQGEKIAEVGSTGNSTGPHLHFEIRRDNRAINPESIMNFK